MFGAPSALRSKVLDVSEDALLELLRQTDDNEVVPLVRFWAFATISTQVVKMTWDQVILLYPSLRQLEQEVLSALRRADKVAQDHIFPEVRAFMAAVRAKNAVAFAQLRAEREATLVRLRELDISESELLLAQIDQLGTTQELVKISAQTDEEICRKHAIALFTDATKFSVDNFSADRHAWCSRKRIDEERQWNLSLTPEVRQLFRSNADNASRLVQKKRESATARARVDAAMGHNAPPG